MLYVKNNKRYTINQLGRLGIKDPIKHGVSVLGTAKPTYDRNTHKAVDAGTENNNIFWEIVPLSASEKEAKLKEAKEELKKLRQSKQLEPIEVFGFVEVFTPDTIAIFTGKALKASLDNTITCNWKTPNGFVTLTAEQIIAIASEVDNRIQALFDKEAELSALMDESENPYSILELWV